MQCFVRSEEKGEQTRKKCPVLLAEHQNGQEGPNVQMRLALVVYAKVGRKCDSIGQRSYGAAAGL